ncbi:hypothetical protein ACFOW1_07990 [Parasediminibacterium paludis]|uniref:VCBS repeat-containing protein n=1 Tax=Parasediminibacterium paludis TaxID=908966 RepID=A0ABV8PUX1_9BACT
MAIRNLLLLVFLVLVSCGRKTKAKDIRTKTYRLKNDTAVSKTVESSLNNTFVKNPIDTCQYLNLPYFDTSMDHSGAQGYIDTFTINNHKFRIIHQDTLFDGTVEKYQNGHWFETMEFENLGNHNDYDISLDLDGDGFRDLIFYWKWNGEVHFFNPIKNEFSDTANCIIERDWTLIDTSKHIFYENQFGKLIHSPAYSNLFILKDAKRIDIATLEISYNPNDDDQNIIGGKLYSNNYKTAIENIIPKNKTSVTDFNYEKFWRDRYLKLIGSR